MACPFARNYSKPPAKIWSRFLVLVFPALLAVLRADNTDSSSDSSSDSSRYIHRAVAYSSKGTISRQYTLEDRVRYQLWDYTWNPDPNKPITRIEVRIGEQKVYVYQGDDVAGVSPTTTGKPGHETPTGHYSILLKDIDHKSNLYGVFLDSNGYVIDGNASSSDKPPTGAVYDAADMPYYLRIRDDGVGLHGGFLPGYPASHGCIRLPHAFAELLFSNVSVGTPVDVVP
jgi:lipoprotein-anchoring transpeptidase ErfK/SrfK